MGGGAGYPCLLGKSLHIRRTPLTVTEGPELGPLLTTPYRWGSIFLVGINST